MDVLGFQFMRRALIASALIGLAAPAIGVFLVQRRLSLMGDGIGHVAITGVAVGLLTSTSPLIGALGAGVVAAVIIEVLRQKGRTAGDVALALIFYGGIAAGVFLTSLSQGSTAGLLSYLFGSVLTVNRNDLLTAGVLSAGVLGSIALFGKQLFAIGYDEEVARVAGIRVTVLNLLVAVTAALTVVVGMRVVGLLLVAALMVIPVATMQNLAHSFRATVAGSLALGALSSVGGLLLAFYIDAAPGPTIVLTALFMYFATATVARIRMAS